MSKKQSLKLPQRIEVTAIDRKGLLVKTQLTVSEFLDYMNAVTERDCAEISILTVQFFMRSVESKLSSTYVRQLSFDGILDNA